MLELVFITSNHVKLAHLRYLCRNYDVVISQKKNYGVGYIEPRIDDRDQLLEQSVYDVDKRLVKSGYAHSNKLFFIEDTSVDIPALRTTGEYPGVDIKYWMKENTFAKIDRDLRQAGNDRRAIVRSDIVLRLPKHLRQVTGKSTLHFTSRQEGTFVEKEETISTQAFYSWLDNKSFNKWFAPSVCTKSISQLPITEADKYDFRAGAVNEMLFFLMKHGMIRHKSYNIDRTYSNTNQKNLFSDNLLFAICGPTCAGKTTIAQHLANKFSYYHIEASDFMYTSYYETHGVGSDVEVGEFAKEALRVNPQIVLNQILRHIADIEDPIVITGFRSPLELSGLQKYCSGSQQIEPLYVDARIDIRFTRSIARNRSDVQLTRIMFNKNDLRQMKMGLSKLKTELVNHTIENNADLESFHSNFEGLYPSNLLVNAYNTHRQTLKKRLIQGLEEAVIVALLLNEKIGEFYTTTEIANLINRAMNANPSLFRRSSVNKNNVSRYFNQYFHPFFDIALDKNRRKYRLSSTGVAHAYYLLRKHT